jgi:hypothetical protein
MAKTKPLTKAAIERAYKEETDAAWQTMVDKWAKAQMKRERQLKALMDKKDKS